MILFNFNAQHDVLFTSPRVLPFSFFLLYLSPSFFPNLSNRKDNLIPFCSDTDRPRRIFRLVLAVLNLNLTKTKEMYVASMRKSFKDSLKVLEADIQHANTLASDFPREFDGACLQMRMSYSPAAHLFLFLVQWTDCNLAGALGLLRILIYKVYVDGTTTMSTQERKASIREFYAVIYPSLLQLQKGVDDTEDKKQKAVCMERYRRRNDEEHRLLTDVDIEREEECGICMEMNSKIVLPNCNHAMCLKCYHEWRSRSQSCPFCRDSLKRVNSGDLWVLTDSRDVVDMGTVTRENLRRLFMYIDKLPLIIPDSLFDTYDSHIR